jgi:hypothetical protein
MYRLLMRIRLWALLTMSRSVSWKMVGLDRISTLSPLTPKHGCVALSLAAR